LEIGRVTILLTVWALEDELSEKMRNGD
jgi:hypothetical protein